MIMIAIVVSLLIGGAAGFWFGCICSAEMVKDEVDGGRVSLGPRAFK